MASYLQCQIKSFINFAKHNLSLFEVVYSQPGPGGREGATQLIIIYFDFSAMSHTSECVCCVVAIGTVGGGVSGDADADAGSYPQVYECEGGGYEVDLSTISGSPVR